MPDPGTNGEGPYSISQGPAGLGLFHDNIAEVAKGVASKAVGVKHCESTLTSSTNQVSPEAFFFTNAIYTCWPT